MPDPALTEMTETMRSRLRCPTCHAGALAVRAADLACEACGTRYPVSHGRPILFRLDNMLFRPSEYLRDRPAAKTPGLARLIPSPSINLASRRTLARLAGLLPVDATILVVGGGTQRRWLDPQLRAAGRTILYCDVDIRATVDLFCDGHDLPFADASFDAVITTAVLEHVLYPERVAAEIARVVKRGGLLYSELPFMQQVHEGAYDFTRYTLSGHRRLFNSFEEINAGMVAGPGTALSWALENFVLAFVRGRRARAVAKAAARLAFGWIKYFDRLLERRPEAMDGASCTYLLGRRAETPVSDSAIIEGYVGAKALSHV